jgi:hypothetical protein
MARCFAIRPNLRAWRCGNEAGVHWFCHQHRRWPLQTLAVLVFGGLLIPWGSSYLYGLFAPPTKVESEGATKLEDIAATVRTILANQTAHPQELKQFVDEQGFENKYPLGFALFYADGSKTLHYGSQPNPDVSFDPSKITALSISDLQIRVAGFAIIVKGSHLTIGDFHIGKEALKAHSLIRINGVDVEAELLGTSTKGAAWIIGLKPAA